MKRNINTNRSPISSEEILKGKNFSELAKAYQAQTPSTPSKPFYKKGWFASTVASIAIITTSLILINKNGDTTAQNSTASQIIVSDSTNTKFINPPVSGVDVKKDRYFVNADTGGEINHFTGSKITIPASAFVSEDGTPITGEVEIEYREFHDQVDIFFSGIPMEYDSAGTKYNFESAGMMEIYAFQNGEKLKVAPKKDIQVTMTSYNADPKFNLYYLDEKAKNWDYRGKDSIASEQDFTYNPSPISEVSELIDPTLFKDIETKKEAVEEQKEVVEIIKKDIKTIEEAKPNRPIKATDNVHSFDIDVNKAEFPEIATYSGTIFEVIDQVNFDAKIYDVQWEDIILTQSGNNLSVELTKGKRKKKIEVKPVLEGADYTTAIKEFSEKFKDYSEKLTTRKADEKKAEEELQARIEAYAKAQGEREEKIKALQKLNYAQREVFGKTKVNRMYSISQMGRWNCDHPRPPKPPTGHRILAKYFDSKTNNELNIKKANLIEKNRNMTWILNPMQRKSLNFNPKRENYIWCITNDDKIAFIEPDDFKAVKNKTEHHFKMNVISPEDKSLEDIKKLIKA